MIYIVVDRVGAPYRVLLYQPGIRFIYLSNSKGLCLQHLYVKPEKCKWKVREVGFLGVVIGLKGIRMEEEKVKGVLDWPTPKCVKDVQKFLGLANYYR